MRQIKTFLELNDLQVKQAIGKNRCSNRPKNRSIIKNKYLLQIILHRIVYNLMTDVDWGSWNKNLQVSDAEKHCMTNMIIHAVLLSTLKTCL
jgi:hypothetical protein